MVGGVTCVLALVLSAVVAAVAVPSAIVRRSYTDGEYWLGSVEDASIAGDEVGLALADCIDDDSESVELAYVIINKREAPDHLSTDDKHPQSSRVVPATAPAAASAVIAADNPNARMQPKLDLTQTLNANIHHKGNT